MPFSHTGIEVAKCGAELTGRPAQHTLVVAKSLVSEAEKMAGRDKQGVVYQSVPLECVV